VLLQVKNGRERSSSLRGLREMERQVGSVRGTRWTVGLGAGHMVARRVGRSHGRSSRCTVAVESRGLAGGRAEHAGFGGLPTKPSEDGFLVWASKPSPKTQHEIRACREASKRRTRGGIAWLVSGGRGVRRRRGRRKTHKHYINSPAWVVSPVVELGVVELFPTPAGPDI
jgi:hypothetical protein